MENTPSGLNLVSTSPADLTTNSQTFVSVCNARKGQFIRLSYRSNPKPSAKFKAVVLEKVSTGIYRTGVDFANLSAVKEGIADGLRGEVQSLPEGQSWAVFPFVIRTAKGGELLRITTAEGQRAEVVFKADGVEVSKVQFESYLNPSARSDAKTEPLLVFTIKAENLISVAGLDLP